MDAQCFVVAPFGRGPFGVKVWGSLRMNWRNPPASLQLLRGRFLRFLGMCYLEDVLLLRDLLLLRDVLLKGRCLRFLLNSRLLVEMDLLWVIILVQPTSLTPLQSSALCGIFWSRTKPFEG